MNILFPVNGLGKRFLENGYTKPKPLIKTLGKPMFVRVLESFDFNEEDKIYIVYHRILKNHNFEGVILSAFPNLKNQIKFLCLQHDTKGAAHTLVEAIAAFGLENDDLLIADCDVIYKENVLKKFRGKQNSAMGTSKDFSKNAIYSYVKINNGFIAEVKEKHKISDDICCGLYYFAAKDTPKISLLYNCGIHMGNEYYISMIYSSFLDLNIRIEAQSIFLFDCVGTPIQLQSFCGDKMTEQKRFCFDLDNTLLDSSGIDGDYSKCKPIIKNINFLKKVKESGGYVIIYTARRMRTHKGNVDEVVKDIGELTKKMLEEYEIEYDELIFGKPWAHFYIDDLAVLADEDLDKSTGFYFNKLESRTKHELTYFDDKCVKKGELSGERYWYLNAPTIILERYFPKFYKVSNNEIIMDTIHDVPLSQLYLRNCFNEGILSSIFNALEDFHFYSPKKELDIDFTENYSTKLEKRRAEILKICPQAEEAIEESIKRLNHMVKIDPKDIRLIHGDPVFSNIFCSFSNELKFIDVRGKVGRTPTIYGHSLYDYAKVYQSILGYDYILLDAEIDRHEINKNKKLFEKMFLERFSVEKLQQVKIITQSLLISLIPLHPKERGARFLKLSNEA